MTRSLKPGARAQAFIVLALVATLGALIGIVADRAVAQRADVPAEELLHEPAPGGPPFGAPGPGRRPGGPQPLRYGARLFALLDLTHAQRAAIDSIMVTQELRVRELNRQFEPQFRAIARQTHASVEAVLTDAQRAQLRALREQRMRMMRQERQRRMPEMPMRAVPRDSPLHR